MRKLLISAVVSATALLLLAPAALAIDDVNTQKLRKEMTPGGVLDHMRSLQRIANRNAGTRAATTPGYEASVEFVQRRLTRAGYKVKLDPFDFYEWTQNGPATLSAGGKTYLETSDTAANDYSIAQFSGSGDVTGTIVPIDYTGQPPAAGASTSGCEASDFPDPGPGPAIALMVRGTCFFVDKVKNAAAAGYDAVLIVNDGFPGREEPFPFTGPIDPPLTTIPQAMTSFAAGEELRALAGQQARFAVNTTTTQTVQHNVIADSKKGDPERTIVVGAHLDSVDEGPGINDNGSGTSALVEMAEKIAGLNKKPRNRIRFAFWGAEEAGLIGSTAYVADLVESHEDEDIEANLNFDMLSSPNFVRFVYEGSAAGAPSGSAEIEGLFLDYFESQGLETEPTAFDGRSDYGPFIAEDIPAGGLFSGAEGVKTAEQAAIYGGAAGSWYDPCYHQACDTYDTILGVPPLDADGLEPGSEAADAEQMRRNGPIGLGQLADAAAHATWTLARSKSSLEGFETARKSRATKRMIGRWSWRGGQRVR